MIPKKGDDQKKHIAIYHSAKRDLQQCRSKSTNEPYNNSIKTKYNPKDSNLRCQKSHSQEIDHDDMQLNLNCKHEKYSNPHK